MGRPSYTYDMLEVGRAAAMLQKAPQLDAEAVTAEDIMNMLTPEWRSRSWAAGSGGNLGSGQTGRYCSYRFQ